MFLLGSCVIHFGQIFVFSLAFAKGVILILSQVLSLCWSLQVTLVFLSFRLLPRTDLDQDTSEEYSADILCIGKPYLGYFILAIAFTVYSSLYKSVTDYEQILWPSDS